MASPPSAPTRSIFRPPISAARRRGALRKAHPVLARPKQGGERLPPSSLLSAADELATLIDQASLVGGVDWDKLDALFR
jgi:hypothetical protein